MLFKNILTYSNGVQIISLLGILTFFPLILIFILEKQTKINLSITIISCGGCLFILNLALSFLYSPTPSNLDLVKRIKATQKIGVTYDTRSKLEVLTDFRKENPDSWPTIHPTSFTKNDMDNLYPLAGISNVQTVYCNETGKFLIYKSDRYGFNNNDSRWDSDLDILLVGDSYVHGACVNQKDSITGVLKNIHNISALALGIGGSGPLIELAFLKEYLSKITTKKVFWFYYEGNDLENIEEELSNPILQKYLQLGFSQDLSKRQNEIDIFLKNYSNKMEQEEKKKSDEVKESLSFTQKLKKVLTLWYLRQKLGLSLKGGNPYNTFYKRATREYKADTLDTFKSILSQAKTLLNQRGIELSIVYLPEFERYLSNYQDYKKINPNVDYRQKKKVVKIINELGIRLLDFDLYIRNQKPLDFFPYKTHGHFNEHGYKELANFIVSKVTKK